MPLRRGCLLRLRAFGGKEIVRRFVRKHKGSVLICSDEEYKLAAREHRQPLCVGFALSDVLDYDIRVSIRNAAQGRAAPPGNRAPVTRNKRG